MALEIDTLHEILVLDGVIQIKDKIDGGLRFCIWSEHFDIFRKAFLASEQLTKELETATRKANSPQPVKGGEK